MVPGVWWEPGTENGMKCFCLVLRAAALVYDLAPDN